MMHINYVVTIHQAYDRSLMRVCGKLSNGQECPINGLCEHGLSLLAFRGHIYLYYLSSLNVVGGTLFLPKFELMCFVLVAGHIECSPSVSCIVGGRHPFLSSFFFLTSKMALLELYRVSIYFTWYHLHYLDVVRPTPAQR